jgi:hypothetical protein
MDGFSNEIGPFDSKQVQNVLAHGTLQIVGLELRLLVTDLDQASLLPEPFSHVRSFRAGPSTKCWDKPLILTDFSCRSDK